MTDFFKQQGATLVSVDVPASTNFNVMPSTDLITSPETAYLRLHGRDEKNTSRAERWRLALTTTNSDEELQEVKGRVEELSEKVRLVHVIFNNNRSNYAPSRSRSSACRLR